MSAPSLTDAFDFDIAKLVFSEPKENTMELKDDNDPNAKSQKIKFYRIDIQYATSSRSTGDLIIALDRTTSSFGFNPKFGTFHINMADRPPSEAHLKAIEVFGEIVEKCKDHLIEVRGSLGKPKMTRANLEGDNDISPLKYAKKDLDSNGDPIKGAIPNLSAKIIPLSKKDSVNSKYRDTFYSEEDDSVIDPLELVDKRCSIVPAIKIESIFVGSVIRVQCKLFECIVKLQNAGPTRLLKAFTNATLPALKPAETISRTNPLEVEEDFEEDISKSLVEDEAREEPVVVESSPPVQKEVGRRKNKKY
jgi:hypothetical protein